ncbi:DNA-directed RNA polymerase subunit beta [Ornithinibacillus scapharcae]|uniref:DNA-directed RNA polymerase subunit beta n=1 Tax=Ornithinibacillus scapharcae TaxID=1147159 RepID=UPI000225C1A8
MSTTNQTEEIRKDTATKKKRLEVKAERKQQSTRRKAETEPKSVLPNEDKKASLREEIRRRSANAELEQTETLKQTRRQQKKKQKEEKRKNRKPRLRIFPIWARIIVVSVLSVIALAVGLMIGYGGLGDGEPRDALKWETWQHIIDIVKKEE